MYNLAAMVVWQDLGIVVFRDSGIVVFLFFAMGVLPLRKRPVCSDGCLLGIVFRWILPASWLPLGVFSERELVLPEHSQEHRVVFQEHSQERPPIVFREQLYCSVSKKPAWPFE
jgi:hypothetical protein